MAVSTLILSIGRKYIEKKGIEFITKQFTTEVNFENELSGVIDKTVEQFRKTYGSSRGDKIHFYESKVVIDQLLSYSLFDDSDLNNVERKLLDHQNILPFQEETLREFLELFVSNASAHPSLKKLEIEANYKNKIYSIYDLLTKLNSSLSTTLREIDDALDSEYHRQLTEIKETVYAFKAQTALERLNALETSITNRNRMTDSIQGRILFLKGLCYEDLPSYGKLRDETFIKAYKYLKNDQEIKIRACVSYYSLGDSQQSEKIREEILDKDEYNLTCWLLRVITNKEAITKQLEAVPLRIKESKAFLPLLYNHCLVRGRVEDLKVLESQYLTETLVMPTLPDRITYENKDFWFVLSHVALTVYYHKHSVNSFPINRDAYTHDKGFQYLTKLYALISNTMKVTEVSRKYTFHAFYDSYFNFIITGDKSWATQIELCYNNLENQVPGNLLVLVQVFVTAGLEEKALHYLEELKTGEDTPNAEMKHMLKCVLLGYLGRKDEIFSSLIKYVEAMPVVTEMGLQNIIAHLDKTINSPEEYNQLKCLVNSKPFEDEQLKLIFNFCIELELEDEISPEKAKNGIAAIKEIKSENGESLKFFVAVGLYKKQLYTEAIDFLNHYLDKTQPSQDLSLYIRCLIEHEQSDKIELLKLLKLWREQADIKVQFLNAEMHLRQFLNDWLEIEEVAKIGLKLFPELEQFCLMLLISFAKRNLKKEIEALIPTIKQTKFTGETNAINVSNILAQFGFLDESLEIIHTTAVDRAHKKARQVYLTHTLHISDGKFAEYPEVVIDSFVTFQTQGKQFTQHITKENETEQFNKQLIGKKKGETFQIKQAFGIGYQAVTVIKIANKYQALFDDIINETDNPSSGLALKKIESDPTDVKDLERKLIENFGAEGSLRKQEVENEFKKYMLGERTFTQIVIGVFGSNFIDAYLHLISKASEGFLTLPSKFCALEAVKPDKQFILDISTIMLFYQAWEESKVDYPNRFFVSPVLIQFLKDELVNTRLSQPSKMTLSITQEGIRPYFYPDDYKEKRIALFENILKWVDKYCDELLIERRIEFYKEINQDKRSADLLPLVVDNSLGMENGYTLITSDYFYYNSLPQFRENLTSPQVYFESRKKQLGNFESSDILVRHRYIGIDLSPYKILEEYKKQREGKENNYSICLQSLNFYYNPGQQIFISAILFLKELYILPWETTENKCLAAQSVFLHMMHTLAKNPDMVDTVRLGLLKEFALLGTSLNLVLNEYDKAIDILRGKI